MFGSNEPNRITVKSILFEAWEAITHVEEGLNKTLVELSTRPGNMLSGYLAGNRYRYQKPFPFLLLSTTLYAFMLHFLFKGQSNQPSTLDFHHRFIANAQYVEQNYYSWIHIVLLPIYGAMSILFFRKAKLYYAEWLVVCCYIISMLLLILIPYQLVIYYFTISNAWNFWLQLIIIEVYSIYALNGFLQSRMKKSRIIISFIYTAVLFSSFFFIVQGLAYLITIYNLR